MYIPSFEEVISGAKMISEDFVDTCIDCGNLFKDFFEDIEHDIQEDTIEKASYIGLDEPVRKYYEKKNRRKRRGKNIRRSVQNALGCPPGQPVSSIDQLWKGDHICIYHEGDMVTHHGIYCGKGKMIHYAPDSMGDVSVRVDSVLYDVMNGEVRLLKESESRRKYPRKEVLTRAYSRFGEREYNLLTNNCEHFARWARCGENGKP